ncbi:MAG: patatin-like phospholipase family protein [Planctomycetota bacterium]|jgi:predicted acylesterase/phospholipase RssA
MEASQRQFLEEVFPAELEEIRARRENVGLDASPLSGAPSAEMGLLGLALSGGGIRSATFSLGVLEAAANAGILQRADYLSTVSGGGYIGSCLSSVLNDPKQEPQGRAFPFQHELGVEEPEAFRHLRNGSNYLAPRGLLNKLRLPALMLRGLMLNLLLFMPLVMLAVQLTELAYEVASHSPYDLHRSPFFAAGTFLLLVVTFPLVSRLLGRRMGWSERDRYEKLLTLAFTASLLLLIWLPIALLVGGATGFTWQAFREATLAEAAAPLESRDYWKWLIPALLVGGFLFAGRATERVARWTSRVLLHALGLVWPSLLLLMYLLLCVSEVDSPFIRRSFAETLDRGEITEELRRTLANRGVELSPASRVTRDADADAWTILDGAEKHRITQRRRFLRVESLDLWDGKRDVAFFAIWAGLLLFNFFFVDVNVTSPHGFYRDRLSRVFLFRIGKDGEVVPNDGQKLSDLNRPGTRAPYHLINAALNLQGSGDPDLRGRNADFFIFSKRFTGGPRVGYCETAKLEEYDRHLDLGTALAISGAAAAPNMGVTTVPSLVFLMTFLNIRLGYWLLNPSAVRNSTGLGRLLLWRGAGPLHLLQESVSGLSLSGSHVNISDGGHVENLAIYELLRRRCRFIVSVDGGADPAHRYRRLIELIRFAKIDMGIKIDVDLADLDKDEQGLSRKHSVLGTIRYGEHETGQLLYIKASLTGDENPYVLDYAAENPQFPHQPTTNQFFTEAQFEAYRALGYHAASRAIAEYPALTELIERQSARTGSA